MKRRQHHFQMKYLVAQMALQDPQAFCARFDPGKDPTYFSLLWAGMAEQFEPQERASGNGAEAHCVADESGAVEELILTFPTPEAQGEAWFVGAFATPEKRFRVFCLESSLDPRTGQASTVLAEFRPNGRANWGPARSAKREDFVSRSRELMRARDAAPLSFLPVRLA